MTILKRRLHRFGLAAVVAAALAALPALVAAQATQWQTTLSGGSETTPVTTTATGTFAATLDEAAGTLTWSLTVPSIQNATASHIHSGAAGANGPIVLNLFAGGPATSISTSGTAKAADIVGPLAGNFAGFVAALKAGTLYVNVHTTANPGGEIRGQLVAAQAPVPPKTGNAGLLHASDASEATVPVATTPGATFPWIALGAVVALALAGTAGGYLLVGRRLR